MYAVVELGGKQHRVSKGERILVDHMAEKSLGDSFTIEKILMTGGETYKVGTPIVQGAKVVAKVISQGDDDTGVKGKKLIAFKRKRRKGFKKSIGHRQRYTQIEIQEITA